MYYKPERPRRHGKISSILVTGGAGYIGSAVCRHLTSARLKVTVLDDLRTGRVERLPDDVKFIQADIACQTTLDSILPEVDAVIHLAAAIDVGNSMSNPISHFINNTAKCINLLEAVLKHGVSRFIFSSTAAVYGRPKASPLTEEHATAPTNAYGESKLMIENTLEWLHRQQSLRFASLRYFNAAGGRPPDTASNLIPVVLEVARGLRPELTIYGNDYPTRDGTAVRDYVHIDDLASAHLLALWALDRFPRQIYNVGTGVGHTVLEVADSVSRVSGRFVPRRFAPRRPGDSPEAVACVNKIRTKLGWHPRFVELDEIVESSWNTIGH